MVKVVIPGVDTYFKIVDEIFQDISKTKVDIDNIFDQAMNYISSNQSEYSNNLKQNSTIKNVPDIYISVFNYFKLESSLKIQDLYDKNKKNIIRLLMYDQILKSNVIETAEILNETVHNFGHLPNSTTVNNKGPLLNFSYFYNRGKNIYDQLEELNLEHRALSHNISNMINVYDKISTKMRANYESRINDSIGVFNKIEKSYNHTLSGKDRILNRIKDNTNSLLDFEQRVHNMTYFINNILVSLQAMINSIDFNIDKAYDFITTVEEYVKTNEAKELKLNCIENTEIKFSILIGYSNQYATIPFTAKINHDVEFYLSILNDFISKPITINNSIKINAKFYSGSRYLKLWYDFDSTYNISTIVKMGYDLSKLLFLFITILKFNVTQNSKFTEQEMYLFPVEDCFFDDCGVKIWCDTHYEERWRNPQILFREDMLRINISNYCNGTMANILDHNYR